MTRDVMSGTQIAGYRVEGVLGRGGMSVVYLAEHVRLQRKVALKLLSPALADDPAFRVRFEREWRIAASVVHDNVIPIYDAGEADGHLYLAMKYVEGLDLRALLARKGRLEAGETLAILAQVASALDAAHAWGLVHRDVKPGNVLCVSDPGAKDFGHVYLADFGLTKRSASQSGLTRMGQFVGTLDYVAPEQIEGRALDGRTDMYALGCVLYECLSGEVPFPRDNDPAVLYAHLREPVPPLEPRRPDIPHGIDEIIAIATAKRPEDRYESGQAFIDALRALLGGPDPAGLGRVEGRRGTTILEQLDAAPDTEAAETTTGSPTQRIRAFLVAELARPTPSPLRAQLAAVASVLEGPLRVAVFGLETSLAESLATTLGAAIEPLEFLPAVASKDPRSLDGLIARCAGHIAIIPLGALGSQPLDALLGRLRAGGASPVRSLGILHDAPTAAGQVPDLGALQARADAWHAEPAVRATFGSVVVLADDDRAATGNSPLQAVLDAARTALRDRSDRLRADWAMARLEGTLRDYQAAAVEDDIGSLRDDLEELRLGLFELDELHALDDLLAGRLAVSDSQANELAHLLDGREIANRLGLEKSADPGELQAAALAGAERWRGFLDANRPTGPKRRAAEIAAGAYDRLWTGLAGAARRP